MQNCGQIKLELVRVVLCAFVLNLNRLAAVHPFSITAYLAFRVAGVLEPIPAGEGGVQP